MGCDDVIVRSVERGDPTGHLVQHDSQRVDIHGGGGPVSSVDFRRHVQGGSRSRRCAGGRCRVAYGCDAEVRDLRCARGCGGVDENILRLDIPVDYSRIVHGHDSGGHVGAYPGDFVRGQRSLGSDDVSKASAVGVVHDQAERIPLHDDVVHFDDIGA